MVFFSFKGVLMVRLVVFAHGFPMVFPCSKVYLQGLPRAPRHRDSKSLGRRATRARTLRTLRTLRTWRRRCETGGKGDVAKDVGLVLGHFFWYIFFVGFYGIYWWFIEIYR